MLRLLSTTTRNVRALSAAASSLRSSVGRLTGLAAVRCASIPRSATATFATSPARRQAEEEEEHKPVPVGESRDALARQLDHESADLQLEHDWVREYVAENNLNVEVDSSNESVLATRKFDGGELRATFRMEPVDEDEMVEEEEEKEEEEEENQEKLPQYHFTVDIVNDSGKVMRVECMSHTNGEAIIESVSFPTSPSPFPVPALSPNQDVTAPPSVMWFDDLTEAGQQACIQYFESIGLDDDLATFVAYQSQQCRTQSLHQSIQKMKEFLQ